MALALLRHGRLRFRLVPGMRQHPLDGLLKLATVGNYHLDVVAIAVGPRCRDALLAIDAAAETAVPSGKREAAMMFAAFARIHGSK